MTGSRPLSQPVKPSDSSFREFSRDAYARRLEKQGLRAEVVRTSRPQCSLGRFAYRGSHRAYDYRFFHTDLFLRDSPRPSCAAAFPSST